MLKKTRSLTNQYPIAAAFAIFILFDIVFLGLKQLFTLLPSTLPVKYVLQIVLIIVPVAFVFFFGYSKTFKKGNLLRGLICCLPYIVWNLFLLWSFFSGKTEDPETAWKSLPMIIFGVFSVFGVGIREECIFRATIQNIVAKKYANSTKGIWITVIVSATIFGLAHVSNLFSGVNLTSVLVQVIHAVALGILFGAIYLRSGSLWAIILIHTLTDVVALGNSTFLNLSSVENLNQMSFSRTVVIYCLLYIGFSIFLLRPSKCKEIQESFCFAGEKSEIDAHTETTV